VRLGETEGSNWIWREALAGEQRSLKLCFQYLTHDFCRPFGCLRAGEGGSCTRDDKIICAVLIKHSPTSCKNLGTKFEILNFEECTHSTGSTVSVKRVY